MNKAKLEANYAWAVCAYIRKTYPDEDVSDMFRKARLQEDFSIRDADWGYPDLKKPVPTDLRDITVADIRALKREYFSQETLDKKGIHKVIKAIYDLVNGEMTTGKTFQQFVTDVIGIKDDDDD